MIPSEIERLLPKVQKPARYCGGEINTIIKDKSKVSTRVAFCFPDLYEVGMSHLGMKLFYSAFNKREEIWCERVFAPAEDMRTLLLENGIKLYGLESFDPLDVLVLCNEPIDPLVLVECYPIGVLTMLDGGKNDEKIIAIPFKDPTYNDYRSVHDLPSHLFDEMRHFFSVYKQLEGKQTAVDEIGDRERAVEIITRCINCYNEKYGDKK